MEAGKMRERVDGLCPVGMKTDRIRTDIIDIIDITFVFIFLFEFRFGFEYG